MVSGAIGGFLDVATNFNTQAFLDDNLIGQFYILEIFSFSAQANEFVAPSCFTSLRLCYLQLNFAELAGKC